MRLTKNQFLIVDFTIDVERSKVNGVEFLSEDGGEYSMKTTNTDLIFILML